MSLTVEEREQWGREINRLAVQGWAEHKRSRTHAIQAANPGISFERAWDQAEREQQNPSPEPGSLGEAVKLVHAQNPTWTFEESWSHAETIYPALVPSSSAASSRVDASAAPHLVEREKWRSQARIEAEARSLMARDPRLTMGVALERARSGASLAQANHVQSVPEIEPKPKGRMLLIRGSEGTWVD